MNVWNGEEIPNFGSDAEAVEFWRSAADELRTEFDEYKDLGQQYEQDMDEQLARLEAENKQLERGKSKVTRELNELRQRQRATDGERETELQNCKQDLENEKELNLRLNEEKRDLEQKLDDLERAHRQIYAAYEDREQMYQIEMEKNALMKTEIDDNATLQETIQRLAESERDLKSELDYRNRANKNKRKETHNNHIIHNKIDQNHEPGASTSQLGQAMMIGNGEIIVENGENFGGEDEDDQMEGCHGGGGENAQSDSSRKNSQIDENNLQIKRDSVENRAHACVGGGSVVGNEFLATSKNGLPPRQDVQPTQLAPTNQIQQSPSTTSSSASQQHMMMSPSILKLNPPSTTAAAISSQHNSMATSGTSSLASSPGSSGVTGGANTLGGNNGPNIGTHHQSYQPTKTQKISADGIIRRSGSASGEGVGSLRERLGGLPCRSASTSGVNTSGGGGANTTTATSLINASTGSSSRLSALSIVGDLLRKVGALETKLASCRTFVRDNSASIAASSPQNRSRQLKQSPAESPLSSSAGVGLHSNGYIGGSTPSVYTDRPQIATPLRLSASQTPIDLTPTKNLPKGGFRSQLRNQYGAGGATSTGGAGDNNYSNLSSSSHYNERVGARLAAAAASSSSPNHHRSPYKPRSISSTFSGSQSTTTMVDAGGTGGGSGANGDYIGNGEVLGHGGTKRVSHGATTRSSATKGNGMTPNCGGGGGGGGSQNLTPKRVSSSNRQ